MKKIALIVCIIAFTSCNFKEQRKSESIIRFENSLGEKELIFLNEMVLSFDTFLDTLYDSNKTDSKYKQFLVDLSKNRVDLKWEIEANRIEEYRRKSNLFLNCHTVYPDSFLVQNNKVTPLFSEHEDYIFPGTRIKEGQNTDSIIQVLKKACAIVSIKEEGQFNLALKSVFDIDNLVAEYLKHKNNNEEYDFRITVKGLLNSYSVDSEYFSKRIFVMNLYP